MTLKKEKTLLIVDDSLIVQKSIIKFLEDHAIKIIGTAGNGLRALEMFKDLNPDIVTLDITMPGIDGLEVLQAMKESNSHSKILIISALADKATALKAIKLGAVGYILKPFNPQKLQHFFEQFFD